MADMSDSVAFQQPDTPMTWPSFKAFQQRPSAASSIRLTRKCKRPVLLNDPYFPIVHAGI